MFWSFRNGIDIGDLETSAGSKKQVQSFPNMHSKIKKMQLDVGNEPTLRLSSMTSIYMIFDEIFLECSHLRICFTYNRAI